MDVRLEPHMINQPRGLVPHPKQLVVVVDNVWAGYIGKHKGAPAMLILRYSQEDREEIEQQLALLLEVESVKSSMVPQITKDPEQERQIDDDLDA